MESNFRPRELPPTKQPIGISVLEAAKLRISKAFDLCEKVYVSFSAGKDSTVMLHLVADEARRRGRQIDVLLVDLEAQYTLTIEHAEAMRAEYADCTTWYWVCLPIALRNAVSMYQPQWKCWDTERISDWVRPMPEGAISDPLRFPFFSDGMEFEEFVPAFGEWLSEGKTTACFVGIRTDESLNRFRTINSRNKIRIEDLCYTTKVTPSVFNWYPIYDWSTEDIWIYHAKHPGKRHNELYSLMHKAGLSIHQQRICQPYGDDQRRGLWLYQLIEPQTWGRVVARVNGANSGAMYIQETGNMTGYGKVTLPPGHTWRSFAELLLQSLPKQAQQHFKAKIDVHRKWWMDRGYEKGLPDEADSKLETARKVPSWRRICKAILRNDYWCKTLGFSQHTSGSYAKYLAMMESRRKKAEWDLQARELKGKKPIQRRLLEE
jgi:predicted phosphoadenosine phosphosulfate sulfurtransferase